MSTVPPALLTILYSALARRLRRRVGALHVGDQVLAIDDVSLDHMTAAEASRLLQSSSGPLLRLEIVPVTARRASDAKRCKGRWKSTANAVWGSVCSLAVGRVFVGQGG